MIAPATDQQPIATERKQNCDTTSEKCAKFTKSKKIRNAKLRKSFGRVIKFQGFQGPSADHIFVDKSMKNNVKSMKKIMINQCFSISEKTHC